MLCGSDGHPKNARGQLCHARTHWHVDGHAGLRGHWPHQDLGQTRQPCGQEAPTFQRRLQLQRVDPRAKNPVARTHSGGRSLGGWTPTHTKAGQARRAHRARPARGPCADLEGRVRCGDGKDPARVAGGALHRAARNPTRAAADHLQPIVRRHGHRVGRAQGRAVHICGQCLRQAACAKQPRCGDPGLLANEPVSQRVTAIHAQPGRATALPDPRQPGGQPMGQ